MLKESGNLLTENISISKELLYFAKANNYKISLKTGDYQKEPIPTTKGQKYNLDLITAVNELYRSGNLYLADYVDTFGISKLDDLSQVFKKNGLKMLTRKETQNLYGDQIKQRTANTIDRKIQAGTRKPRKMKVPKLPKEPKQPKVKEPKPVKTPKAPKQTKTFKISKIETPKITVTENGQAVENFSFLGYAKLDNNYLVKALKLAYREDHDILDQILESGKIEMNQLINEVWSAYNFVHIAEHLFEFIAEHRQVYYEKLTVGDYSFDYYIPERNLVIEVTNIPEFTDNLVDNQYFKRMNKSLAEKGIKLLRFGIDDVYEKTDLVVSMIEHHLGLTKIKIPARKCKLVELTAQQAREFAEANHLNGHANAQVYYGLEYQGELVQIITFAKHRYHRNDSEGEIWEVIRACSKKYCIVQGGTQKIFKHFKNLHEVGAGVELHTYCDMNISDGNSYALAGELIEETTGDLWYIIPDKYSLVGFKRVIRNRMMKIYLHKYFEGFPKRDDPSYKEINSVEFLRQQGIFAYYGSGNLVYKL